MSAVAATDLTGAKPSAAGSAKRRAPRSRLTRGRVVLGTALLLAVVVWTIWPRVRLDQRLHTARDWLREGNAERALAILAPEEGGHADSAELQFLLGVAHRRANHLRVCGEYFRRASALGWPRSELRTQEMMAAFQSGDAAAEAELKAFLRLPMDDEVAEEVCEALAKGYFGRYWLNQALTCIDHWISWRPQNPRPRHLRAMILSLSGDVEQQIKDYRAIIAVAPEDFSAHALLGDALMRTNSVDQALVQYRWCRERAPHDPLAALGVAVCLRRRGNFDEARRELEEVIAGGVSEGQRGRLLAELGEVAFELGDVQKAADYLVEAVKSLPFDSATHYSCGIALARVGKKDEADRMIKAAEELTHRQERIFDVETQLANNPDDPDLRYEAATLLKGQNLDHEAETLMLTALKLDPTHARAHQALADWYQAQGKTAEAERHRAVAVQLSGAAAESPKEPSAEHATEGGS
ncbi:MAG TPA: tetratricopeptide repeat protein [Pirellulales bacterium]|jgi:Flp pilus assembly protein TadD|nr:tetratricopeptide repeat protein [Pirellulales bacterium]